MGTVGVWDTFIENVTSRSSLLSLHAYVGVKGWNIGRQNRVWFKPLQQSTAVNSIYILGGYS